MGNTLGGSSCCHCIGGWIVPISNGQTLLLHSVYCCIYAEHQVHSEKRALPALTCVFTTHFLKTNNDLLSVVLAVWTLLSFFALFLL